MLKGIKSKELMFRLAEKYFEEGRYEHNIEMQRYQERNTTIALILQIVM